MHREDAESNSAQCGRPYQKSGNSNRGTFNRILKRETISEPLKERMTNLLIEAQKLDSIVKDYETILKSRQIMFKVEDLNKITQSVLPLVEER